MKKTLPAVLFAFLFIFLTTVISQEYEFGYDVPFVPTRYEVLDEMLEMAGVSKDDILYDLGCGDGRIVITAAEKLGVQGVGIDIDPQRIKESKENAEEANVTDRVRFIEQNLFDADISEATVVTLYLLSSVNLKLRPKLLRELKPGTRVVSHNYNMGNWEPEESSEVSTEWNTHSVYFWVIPANVTGDWEWTPPAGTGSKQYVMHINQQFQYVNGTVTTGSSQMTITDGVLNGDRLQFTIEETVNGRKVPMNFEGHVDGNSVEGTVNTKTGFRGKKSAWKATRDPSTVVPLDSSDEEE